jgi:AcrR family transcriptional regulator
MPLPARRRAPRPPRRPRRAPQARSVETRRRLLEATVACLVELGYAGTTTTRVCRRAGVSQGALFKHFPTKTALLGATVRHLFAGLVDDFRAGCALAAGERDRLPAALRLLRQSFEQPRLLAAFELFTAARTDARLRGALAPVLEEHREHVRAEARALFPDTPLAPPARDALVDVVVAALQGAALGALVLPDSGAEARGLALLERLARQELAGV